MPLFLSNRDSDVRERMDDPACNPELLHNTYKQFHTINSLLGRWKKIYKKWIRPVILDRKNPVTILDIGCGGGDILAMLSDFCIRDQFNVHLTGIDPDPRAIHFVNQKKWPGNVDFYCAAASDLSNKKQKFDIVLSNHLMHHLSSAELLNLCDDAVSLAQQIVIFSDIERSDVGFTAFSLISPLVFRNSFIAADGITSIKRSYTRKELQQHLPDYWTVHKTFPFRLLAVHQKRNHES